MNINSFILEGTVLTAPKPDKTRAGHPAYSFEVKTTDGETVIHKVFYYAEVTGDDQLIKEGDYIRVLGHMETTSIQQYYGENARVIEPIIDNWTWRPVVTIEDGSEA